MPRLIMIIDVPDVDPTLVDPHEVADNILDERVRLTLITAEWGE